MGTKINLLKGTQIDTDVRISRKGHYKITTIALVQMLENEVETGKM